MIQFEMPEKKSSIIKVIGVGGGGGNAVNYMHSLGIEGVDFVLCNTDVKALEQSNIPLKVQLGPALTAGLGAGANPEIGQKACEESIAEITNILKDNTKMAFITAGMGGGTGTGGAPIVSKISKELGILTVGIVTTPFSYEGPRRKKQAEEGIAKMRENVDTILVISNDKVRHQFGNLGFKNAFAKADDVLATAAKCITDVINSKGHVIVDFADVCTVMRDGGVAILGSSIAIGDNRAQEAVERAINSPLLNDSNISGAKWILLNINSAEGPFEHTLDEMDVIQQYVQSVAGDECNVILGMGYDNNLEDAIGVTIIATGFDHNKIDKAFDAAKEKPEDIKVQLTLGDTNNTTSSTNTVDDTSVVDTTNMETPELTVVADAAVLKASLMPHIHIEAPAVPNIAAMGMRPTPPTVVVAPEKIVTPLLPTYTVSPVELPMPNADVTTTSIVNTPMATTAPAEITSRIVFDMGNTTEQQHEAPETVIAQVAQPTEEPTVFKSEVVAYEPLADDIIIVDGIELNRRMGSRYLTEDEIAEKVNFELSKKRLEDRASRLRDISHNVSVNNYGNMNDVENVPAYLRQNKSLENHPQSHEKIYSQVQVNNNGTIETRNNFLDGDKPC
jgi:cell division protein FtsZ